MSSSLEPVARSDARYEPFGWQHWPEHPRMSAQFRRVLGETQAGGGAISECFQAASRMEPGDPESWHREWLRVAERNRVRAERAEEAGNVLTARAAWLRACNYYRAAEFWLAPEDPRRLATFGLCEECFQSAGRWFSPPLEKVSIPYEGGVEMDAYLVSPPVPASAPRAPVLIAFGGLDSFKEELLFMVGRGVLERGIACLFVDGPGQGSMLRRHGVPARHDYEVPVGLCIDYLETRADVDPTRIAVCGPRLGGYYAARAASYDHRVAAAVSHGAIWDLSQLWSDASEDHARADMVKWAFGAESVEEVLRMGSRFRLEGVLEHMRCPYLILHGGHDVENVKQATRVYEYALAHGVSADLVLISEEETGAEHCQHDNPSIGMEYLADWLAERFAIDQPAVCSASGAASDQDADDGEQEADQHPAAEQA